MKASNKHSARLLKVLAVLVLFLVIGLNSLIFSRIALNGSGQGYSMFGKNLDSEDTVKTNIIEEFVVEGAGYFLKATSDIQAFLHMIEWQDLKGIDYDVLNQLSTNALDNIANAGETYGQLVQTASATPYNPDVQYLLKSFDYDSFREMYDLNPAVFARVREYLETGDITGSFKLFHANIIAIEKLLREIHIEITANRFPGFPLLWKLNEICSETLLFGSFQARIFYSLN